MRVLYQVIDNSFPDDLELTPAMLDILTNWKPNYNLFSISQIAERNNIKRGQCQRQVSRLIKRNRVKKWLR